jgi:hypothetical protein
MKVVCLDIIRIEEEESVYLMANEAGTVSASVFYLKTL